MRTAMIIMSGFFVMLIVGVVVLFSSYVSTYNFANSQEAAITAEYKNNQNILGQYSTKLVEMAQVPSMAKADIIEVIKANMSGRYGPDGSGASMQWIKENNLSIPSDLYSRLQQTMEAGRNKFENGQTALLSKCQVYEAERGKFIRQFFFQLAGYPKIDIVKICAPIQSDHSKASFESGIDNGVKLR